MAKEYSIKVEDTNITIKGDDPSLLELEAKLMSPTNDHPGLNAPEARKLARKLNDQNITPDLIEIAQKKKSLTPDEAVSWLLRPGNKFVAIAWRNKEKNITPPPDHTV